MKGQITVEYLIILVIMTLLFYSVSMDLMSYSLGNSMQVQTNEIIRLTESNLLSAASSLSLQAQGAKTTVKARASPDCDFIVYSDYLEAVCSPESASFNEFNSTKFAQAPAGIHYSCLTCQGGLITNEQIQTIQVYK